MLVSHALVLGLTLILVTGLVAALNIVRENTEQSILQSAVETTCVEISMSIKLLSESDGYAIIDIPELLKDATISGNGNEINVNQDGTAHTCYSSANITGEASGSKIKIAVKDETARLGSV